MLSAAPSLPWTILPGWRLGRTPLQPLARALQATILDLPGYGETPPAASFDEAIATLLTYLPHRTNLLGWSLGAILALAIALHAPHRLNALALIAATPSFLARPGWPHGISPHMLAAFRAQLLENESTLLVRFVTHLNRGDPRPKERTAQLLALVDPPPPLSVLLTGLDWLAAVDLRPNLPHLHPPTLLLHGEKDPLIPLAAAQTILRQAPNAHLSLIPDAAHAPFLSHLPLILSAISKFSRSCR
ncbi:MAG: alpha/beta fold hydrolase [Hydrogenophilus sp.]|nr:alpha/beta fold hydrolase [Hydrogenophilus sp.]